MHSLEHSISVLGQYDNTRAALLRLTKYIQIMKKIVLCAIIVMAMGMASSCAKSEARGFHGYTPTMFREQLYSDEVERALDVVYAASCEYLTHLTGKEVTYDPKATDEWKLFMIREADLADEDGDVIPEVPEYDEIYEILWPAGYPAE